MFTRIKIEDVKLKHFKVSYVTDKVEGEIEKVVLIYNKKYAADILVKIVTSDGEKILEVQGHESGIYYPRNWDLNGKHGKMNTGSPGMFSEKYTISGPLFIFVEGSFDEIALNQIEILIKGEVTESKVKVNKAEIEKKVQSVLDKEAVTTSTPGVFNPTHGRIKKEVQYYMLKTLRKICKEEKVSVPIEKADIESKSKLITQSIYDKKFQGVSQAMSNTIKDYLMRAITRDFSVSRSIKQIVSLSNGKIKPGQAEVISRTEGQALRNSVREWAFEKTDPEGVKKYQWLGPSDHRTSLICKNIVKRTKNGVNLDRLREIVREESIKGGFDGSREWTPHFSCRHTFSRFFK